MSPALHQRRLFCCLVAVLLATSGTPATAVSATPAPPVGFTDDFPTEQRGDVAELGVRFSDAEVATVRVGSESDHLVTATVRDTDDDGRANLRLNTYDGSVAASDGDAIAVHRRSNVTTPFDAGKYDLDLWKGNGTGGERWAVGTLVIQQRSTENLRTWVAPESADLTGLRDLRAAKASEILHRSPVVSERDTLVFELRASGFEGAIAGQNGPNATARFFEAFDGTVGDLTVWHLHPGPSQAAAALDLRNHTATTVVPDPANDTYFLVMDLPNAWMNSPDGEELYWSQLRSGEYRATVEPSAASGLAGSNESVTTEFSIEPPTAHLDTPRRTDRVFVAPGPNQTVAGTTPLAPGTDLTVRIHDEIGNVVGSKTVAVRNGTDGRHRFAATFDFGNFTPGRNFTVTAKIADGSMLRGSRTGQEGAQGVAAVSRASVNLTDRGLAESGVVVENATLSHGGYVAIHRESADGEVLARSEPIVPGKPFGRFLEFDTPLASNTTLVAVAHRDGPGDTLGEPYTENGAVVADSVEFTVERETTNLSTERTTAATTDATATETRTPTPDGEVPGFGVGATLVALLAGFALTRRK